MIFFTFKDIDTNGSVPDLIVWPSRATRISNRHGIRGDGRILDFSGGDSCPFHWLDVVDDFIFFFLSFSFYASHAPDSSRDGY